MQNEIGEIIIPLLINEHCDLWMNNFIYEVYKEINLISEIRGKVTCLEKNFPHLARIAISK